MKKALIIAASVLFSLLLALSVFSYELYPDSEVYGVRVGPDGLLIMEFGSDDVIRLPLEMGEEITVVGEYRENEFIVEIPGYPAERARVTADELAKTVRSGEDVPPEIGEKQSGAVACAVSASSGLGLMSGPGEKYDLKGTVPYGAELGFEYVFGNWGYVIYNGTTGWVSLDGVAYIAQTEPAATDPAATEPAVTDPSDTDVIAPSTEPSSPSDTSADTVKPPETEPSSPGGDSPTTEKDPAGTGGQSADPSGKDEDGEQTGLPVKTRILLGGIALIVIISLTVAAIIALVVRADRKKNAAKRSKKRRRK